MAVGNVSIVKVENQSYNGSALSMPHSSPVATQVLTSLVSSVTSTISATDLGVNTPRQNWRIVFPVDVWVKFGSAPTAAAGSDFLVPANTIGEFSAVAGDKVAVINA